MIETEPRWSVKKTERMLVNVLVGVIVMLLSLATAAVNWKQAQARAELFAWMEQLQQRVTVLETAA